ncbi:hypothetical protein [Tenuifilum sp.]|nr:hypothetical protein [Bacteroidales bacterium]MBP9029824.1 hypothetical protein [Bacteroidales bacterium]HON71271.1 hypothetical protein [Tenuifilum sp.]HQG71943.1 hypothetical protein [Tenuifilum sp.]HRS43787.1 hypothetical protein [Tenuifilum sp.]
MYEKVRESKYSVGGDCVYIEKEICPKFSLLFIDSSCITIKEIKLDNKTIFKLDTTNKLKQFNHNFISGKKKIELIIKDKSVSSDSVCLDDWCEYYWLTIEKDKENNICKINIKPVTLD